MILDYYASDGDEFIDQLHATRGPYDHGTSASSAETVRRLISRGVTDYLVKPFEYDRFKAALERFAKRRENIGVRFDLLGQAESTSSLSRMSLPADRALRPSKV